MTAYHSLTEAERAQIAIGMIDEQIDRIQGELIERENLGTHPTDPAVWHAAWERHPDLAKNCDYLYAVRSVLGPLRAA